MSDIVLHLHDAGDVELGGICELELGGIHELTLVRAARQLAEEVHQVEET